MLKKIEFKRFIFASSNTKKLQAFQTFFDNKPNKSKTYFSFELTDRITNLTKLLKDNKGEIKKCYVELNFFESDVDNYKFVVEIIDKFFKNKLDTIIFITENQTLKNMIKNFNTEIIVESPTDMSISKELDIV